MTVLSRRQFCALVTASVAGAAVLATSSCSNGDGTASGTTAAGGGLGGPLAGASFAVRRDPG